MSIRYCYICEKPITEDFHLIVENKPRHLMCYAVVDESALLEQWESIGRRLDELRQHIPKKDFGDAFREPTLRPEILSIYTELDAIRAEQS